MRKARRYLLARVSLKMKKNVESYLRFFRYPDDLYEPWVRADLRVRISS